MLRWVRKQSKKPIDLVHYFTIGLVAGICLFPIYWLFTTSFKPSIDAFIIPPKWFFSPTLMNYDKAFRVMHLGHYLKNSIIVTGTSVIFAGIVGTMAGYCLARFKFRGSENISFWILSIRMFPFISAALPLYLIISKLGLLDRRMTLIMVYTAFNIPFVVWMMKGYFEEIPKELEEAALTDGCNVISALYHIALPLGMPGLVATVVFCTILCWNEFIFALVLTVVEARTVPVLITQFKTNRTLLWGQMAATSVIVIIPILIFAVLVQKRLIRVMTFGAIKE